MAPTLMGRHKEITCPQCGFVYAVNASEEVEGRSLPRQVYSGHLRQLPLPGPAAGRGPELQGRPDPGDDVPLRPAVPAGRRRRPSAGTWSSSAIPRSPRSATSSGWSACPARRSGSITATSTSSRPGGDAFRLARKPLEHQSAMQMTVYDDRHRPRALADRPEWRRWQPPTPAAGRSSSPASAGIGPRPTPSDRVGRAALPPPRARPRAVGRDPRRPRRCPRAPRPTLITDFYSYNTNLTADGSNLVDEPRGETGDAPGCSPTGSAT